MMSAHEPVPEEGAGAMPAKAKAIILMYHRITRTELDPWGMCVSPENFSEHLHAIRQVATPMSLVDFVRARESGELPERAVVVTFDDGYLDNFERALPLLRQHQVPATLFITTCNIDSPREFWWDRLETLLLAPTTLPERLELPLDSGVRVWELGSAANYSAVERENDRGTMAWLAGKDGRLRFFYDVWKSLWPLAADKREQALDQLANWSGVDSSPSPSRRSMSSAEIHAMGQESLMTIGAHTVDHPPLSAHPAEFQSEQILLGRENLQQILGVPVTTFAYPHGEYSPETIRLLRNAGFECAVTVQQKVVGLDSDDMTLPRFGVRDLPGGAFRAQLDAWFGLPEMPATA